MVKTVVSEILQIERIYFLYQGGQVSHLERSLGENLPSSEHYLGLTNVRRAKCSYLRAIFSLLRTVRKLLLREFCGSGAVLLPAVQE